jgi:tetratricopeptide (TPR) repeat protein
MKTKVYYHYEPPEGNAVTITVTIDDETTLELSVSSFLQSIQSMNPQFSTIQPQHCTVKSENGKILSLKSKKPLLDILGEDRDLFILVEQPPIPPPAPQPVSSSSVTPSKPVSKLPPEIEQSITLLKEFMTKRLYKRANYLCEKLILGCQLPNISLENSPYQQQVIYGYQCLMEIHYNARRFNETVKIGHQLLLLFQKENNPSATSSTAAPVISKINFKKFLSYMKTIQYFEIFYIIAKSYYELKQYQKCLEIITITIDLYQTNIYSLHGNNSSASSTSSSSSTADQKSTTTTPSKSSTAAGKKSSGSKELSEREQKENQLKELQRMKQNKNKIHFLLNMIALQAESTYLLGEHIQAANILNQIMDNPFADSNLLILKTYILFTFQYFKYNETMAAVLKTIAIIGTESKKLSTISSIHSLNATQQLSPASTTTIASNSGYSSSHQHSSSVNAVSSTSVSSSSNQSSSSNTNSDEKSSKKSGLKSNSAEINRSSSREEATSFTPSQQDSDDELDANFQIFNYEYSSQMKLIKQLIIKFLLTKEGYEQLLKRLPPNSRGTGEIYAYLATIAKEFSAIELAIKLYELTLQIQPNYISYALNLIHIYELSFDYSICLEIIQIFCAKNLTLSIGKDRLQSLKCILTCSDIINMMKENMVIQSEYVNAREEGSGENSNSGSQKKTKSNEKCEESKYLYFKIIWNEPSSINKNGSAGKAKLLSASATSTMHDANDLNNGGYATVERYVFVKETTETAPSTAASASQATKIPKITFLNKENVSSDCSKLLLQLLDEKSSTSSSNLIPYHDRELDLIALIATMVKIYFLQGNFFVLPYFIERLEIIRKLSLKPLHKTLVRNELAYYQDIIQIMSHRSQSGWYGLQYLLSTADGNHHSTLNFDSIPSHFIQEYSYVNMLTSSALSLHPVIQKARENPIYIVGDSHTLSLSWNIIQRRTAAVSTPTKGKSSSSSSATEGEKSYSLLIPRLVTGVKQWHLRNDSTFYPKQNFYNGMTDSVPKQSEVRNMNLLLSFPIFNFLFLFFH